MIEFENAKRTYGQKIAVSDLTLRVRPGELLAFLGPNGAGKTTAIKMLVGLLRPTVGRVTVCGHDTAMETREASRFMGFVPDEAFLYDKLSGREFLQFVAEMRGIRGEEAAARIRRQTELFELGAFRDDLTETYSHGMRQRLVFASALLHDPPVLVLDEPMVGLDPKSARLVKDLLQQRAAAGAAVFMSTHTLSVAEEIANRIGIIDNGKLQFLGTIEDLRQKMSAHEKTLEHLFLELTSEAGNDESVGQVPVGNSHRAQQPD